MTTHITTVMNRYKGRCKHWDVVNEGEQDPAVRSYPPPPPPLLHHANPNPCSRKALEEDGTYKETVFLDVIGPAYIPIAFKAAAAADPSAKLYYNDFNLEAGDEKTLAAVELVKMVQKAGARIDGVGFQGHFTLDEVPNADDMSNSLRSLTDLGVDVAYTEMDVRVKNPISAQKLQKHAQAYADLAKSCLSVPRCVGITIWVSSLPL